MQNSTHCRTRTSQKITRIFCIAMGVKLLIVHQVAQGQNAASVQNQPQKDHNHYVKQEEKAQKEVCFLFTELSSNKTVLGAGFKGKNVTVFANRTCQGGKTIFTVRGQNRSFKINNPNAVNISGRAKKGGQTTFYNVPSLYMLATKYATKSVMAQSRAKELSIGLENAISKAIIRFATGEVPDQELEKKARQRLMQWGKGAGVFAENEESSARVQESKFLSKVNMRLPKGISPGGYIFETLLVNEGGVASISIDPFLVVQAPMGNIIREISANHKPLYYLITVCVALGMGLISFSVFEAVGSVKLRRRLR